MQIIILGSEEPSDQAPSNNRKAYHKPVLELLGDIRSVTLGGSIGSGESGFARDIRVPTPGGPIMNLPNFDSGSPGQLK
jgi:hypothetical protein